MQVIPASLRMEKPTVTALILLYADEIEYRPGQKPAPLLIEEEKMSTPANAASSKLLGLLMHADGVGRDTGSTKKLIQN